MNINAETIVNRFPGLLRFVDGDKMVAIQGPSSQAEPKPGTISFVSDEKCLSSLLDSDVSAIVVHDKLVDKVTAASGKALLASPNPYLAMAQVNATFFSLSFKGQPFDGERIHPTAVISRSAEVAESAVIGPNVVIGEHVIIGESCYIGANSVIETHSRLGRHCFLHPHVHIGHSCRIGDRVEIKPHTTIGGDGYGYAHDEKGNHYRVPHYGEVIIEDDVHIGSNCSIDRGTFEPSVIGAGTKIDNLCHFGHNIKMGKNCLVTAGMITAGSATIGDNCVFGGRASVNGHIEIVSGTTVGPLSGVTSSITKPGVYGGFPVIEFKEFRKVHASLASLPRLRKQMQKVLKHLGLHGEDSP